MWRPTPMLSLVHLMLVVCPLQSLEHTEMSSSAAVASDALNVLM